ncbi:c-type cytochrome [Isosphaeraceae bacterium EP7]
MRRLGLQQKWFAIGFCFLFLVEGPSIAADVKNPPLDTAAVERGRDALLNHGYLKSAWGDDAYRRVGKVAWGPDAPDPDREPEAYAAEFARRYGLHTAPYPNDGLPMGLRKGKGPQGTKLGIQIDCMACHGGSIGGQTLPYLGNSTLDLRRLFTDLTRADGRVMPPTFFTINSSRGTVNAGMFSVVLLSLRNTDLTKRIFPVVTGASLPELDTPAWWHLKRKATMYQDGRTDARSVRTNMQFMLGELTAQEFRDLEPTFRDIRDYLLSLEAPKYPFPIDQSRAARGSAIFQASCVKCHGTYGPDGKYPSKIVALDVVGTDPARAKGLSDRFVAHYNATWFGEDYPVNELAEGYQAPPLDGLWATAPYLHNGSIPNIELLLKSTDRPAKFRRPPSTDFVHFDQQRLGWKAEPAPTAEAKTVDDPFLVDTSRFGMGNGGHTFGDKLTDGERQDLIEYLKTL